MQARLSRQRQGFTLVELLVVIGVGIVLATLIIGVTPSSSNRAANRGAEQLRQWLSMARQRAARDQVPRGLQLIFTHSPTANRYECREARFLEQPEPFTTMGSGSTVNVALATPNFAVISPLSIDVNPILQPIAVGDFLELTEIPDPPHRILGVLANTPAAGQVRLVLSNQITPAINNATVIGTPTLVYRNWRVIRQPRPLLGEEPLLLPQDVIVASDADPLTTPPYPIAVSSQNLGLATSAAMAGFGFPPQTVDIMFSPNGQVLGRSGQLFMTIAHAVDTRTEMTIVAVRANSGQVGAFPLNLGGDLYSFARDGRGP